MRTARLAIALLLILGLMAWSPPPVKAAGELDDLSWAFVDLYANYVAYDSNSGLLVVSVQETDPNHANEVIALDPVTLNVEWSVPFATPPGVVAVSDDGSTVYVGVRASRSVVRINTASRSVVATIPLPDDPYSGPVEAGDIAVAPGNPHLIAVASRVLRTSSTSRVTIFDDGVPLPDVLSTDPLPDSLEFSEAASILYGQEGTSGDLFQMKVESTGVTIDDHTPDLEKTSKPFKYVDGRIYFEHGAVADPAIPSVIGRYAADRYIEAVAPLSSLGYTMTISSTNVSTTDTLTLFDLDGFNIVDEADFAHGQSYGVQRSAAIDGHGIAAVYGYGSQLVIAGFFPGGNVVGRVTDAVTRNPISEVCVYATDNETYIFGETETLSDGTYDMRVPPGTWRILFADCKYADYFAEWHSNQVFFNFDKATPVTVTDGATITVNASMEPSFADSFDSVFRTEIWWMQATGITAGCGSGAYCPDSTVTRGQMAAFLVRALGLTATSGVDFTDDDDSIFERDINKLATAGITRGCNPPTNDRFCPDDPVTRGQMAAFLVRALGLTVTSDIAFIDDDGNVFELDINKLATAGITRGCNPPANDQFCPHDRVTREQMAAFLFRALEDEYTVPLPSTSMSDKVPSALAPRPTR